MKTRIRLVFLVWLYCSFQLLLAQNTSVQYGDEWINDEQEYYKFFIEKAGIYRLSMDALLAAGVPAQTIKGRQFQLFSLGSEIPIRITTNDFMGAADFIEFYATANDGSADALLYADANNQQLNPAISLYSDQRPYYLTWSNEEEAEGLKRFREISNGLDQGILPLKEPYYIHREIRTYNSFHHKPSHDGRNFIRYSSFDYAEGYGSELAKDRTIEWNVSRLSSFGVDPRVKLRFGTNVFSRNWEIATADRILSINPQGGYGIVEVDERIPLDEISEGTFSLFISPLSDDNEKHTIATAELHYPRKYEFDGERLIQFTQQASIISRYIEIQGFGGSNPIIYNLTTNSYMLPKQENDLVKLVTSAANKEHDWILIDQDEYVNVSALDKVVFDSKDIDAQYLIVSHEELINTGTIQEYADYRSSNEGGNYSVHIANINHLIDRFAYGIKGHPLALKRLMSYLKDKERLPDYTFIIGKGLEYTEAKGSNQIVANVPTFGVPGSDNLFMAFEDGRHPVRPIGRLAAQTADEVIDYLNKIKTHELRNGEEQTIDDQAWKKEIIHLSGGSAGNQATIFRFLNEMGNVLRGNTFGADVFTFRKTSADPLQRSTTEDIMNRIDQGAALLTFFGHSAVGTFDFSLEDPSKYQNQGRNPVILSLGCHSGNIHTPDGGISESFVLEKDVGAIAFIASSGTAYPEPQYFTGIHFYDLLGDEMYGMPIGDILQKSLEMRSENPSISVQTLIEQLTLHGDPAYRTVSFKGPDYSIDSESVSVQPGIINATSPFYTLEFDVLNLGATRDEILDIQIVHFLPSGEAIDTQDVIVPAPAYSNTIQLELNNPGVDWTGNNQIHITIDPQNVIEEFPNELAEKNNELINEEGTPGMDFYVFDNSAKPIIPRDFGIVGEAPFRLLAAVNNGLNPGGRFMLQIDTTIYFNSPLLREEIRDNEYSNIEWRPDIEVIPGAVYYWRIAPVEEATQRKAYSWQSASFVYLPEQPPGWNQSHYFQLKQDEFYKINLPETTRQLEYAERVWDVRIKNKIRAEGDFWVFVNNTPWASLNPRNMGSLLSVFIWDRQDVLFENRGSDYGSIPFTSDGFLFEMDQLSDVEGLSKLLRDVPVGARVFLHTILESDTASLNMSLWQEPLEDGISLLGQLESQGARRVGELINRGTVPYTLIFDKNEGLVVEDIANNVYETIDLSSRARTLWEEGSVVSVPISEQNRWLRLKWAEEKEENDQSRLVVLGIKPGKQRDTLKIITNDYDVNLTNIDPARYPEIQLIYQTADAKDKSPPQLIYWRVYSQSLPDPAFATEKATFQISDTVNAGEMLHLDFDLVNLTEADLEPVLMRYTLIDNTYKEHIYLKRTKPLKGLDTVQILEQLPTDGLSGNFQIVVEINPNEDQKEVTDCNNLGYANFYIRPDRRNPFLNVTFDGRKISNGEKVNPNTEIRVSLRDESSNVLLNNPEDFDITIFYPEVFEWKIDTSSHAVEWKPADNLAENEASIIIRPNFNVPGVYVLEAQAKDIAGNLAGAQTYRVAFEVSVDTDVPKITVRPNPLRDFSEFVYFLDSPFTPEIFDLYIYSADGRLVKHASKADFGGLRQGYNTYSWDGLSDYGELLATGLYFYEIVNSIDSRKEKAKGSILILRD